jgi:hypothetical protein
MSGMRFGLFYLPTLPAAIRADGAESLRTVLEQICYGKQLGFDSVVRGHGTTSQWKNSALS